MKNFKPVYNQNKKVKHVRFLGLCKSCGLCISKCPVKCLRFSDDKIGYYGLPAIDIDIDKCTVCGMCERTCPDQAITVIDKRQEQLIKAKPKKKVKKKK